jgi:hypothetical protein
MSADFLKGVIALSFAAFVDKCAQLLGTSEKKKALKLYICSTQFFKQNHFKFLVKRLIFKPLRSTRHLQAGFLRLR